MPAQRIDATDESSIKERVATPLTTEGVVSAQAIERLRALSVSTVEELLGLIESDPDAVASFVPELDLPQFQADAQMVVRAPVLADIDAQREAEYSLGALEPDDPGALVEDVAGAEMARSWRADDAGRASATGTPAAVLEGDAVSLLDCFGPIRDQGQRGTCVAHAAAALLECQVRRSAGRSIDASEQFIYWQAKQRDGHPVLSGTWLHVAAAACGSVGSCLEATWPYNPVPDPYDEGQGPPPNTALAEAAQHVLQAPVACPPRDSAAICRALDAGCPVAISIPVYDNWYANPAANALGLIPMPLPNSVRRGGHALCVAGYGHDEDFAGGGYLIVRNSWGTAWAPRSPLQPGYGALPMLYVDRYGWEAWSAS